MVRKHLWEGQDRETSLTCHPHGKFFSVSCDWFVAS